jgi:tetrahydrodipicolinate N-succinyltransferase
MVGVRVMVGVSVSVGVNVKVGVNVEVGTGVSVHESAMAVRAVAVCVARSSGEKLPRLQLRRKNRQRIRTEYFFM